MTYEKFNNILNSYANINGGDVFTISRSIIELFKKKALEKLSFKKYSL